MRWIAYLAVSSLAALALLSCKTDPKPQTQKTAKSEHKTTPMSKADETAVRLVADRFVMAMQAQDFDTMWSLIDPESKKRVGLASFVKQFSYAERGSMLMGKVDTVEGLGSGRALVRTLIEFQWAPSVFGTGETLPVTFDWPDEWVRQPDGQWLRAIAQRDEKAWKEAEEICANAAKQANPFLQ